MFRHGSKSARVLKLAVQSVALIACWAMWARPALGELQSALFYVFLVWMVAGGIILGIHLAFSLAPLSDLLLGAWRASANAMWLVPGTLLLAARWPVAVAAGVAVVINSTRLLALTRPPDQAMVVKRHAARESEPRFPAMLGALALETGVYALAWQYPLLAAASFAAATSIWVAISVARGALEARLEDRVPYPAARVLLTVLWTVTLTAVLLHVEIVVESPVVNTQEANIFKPPETPGMTRRVLRRLAQVPPPTSKVEEQAAKAVVTRVVDPSPAIEAKDMKGVPGVVLRTSPPRPQRPPLIVPGARLQLSSSLPLTIPFTGEYELFRTSSGTLPQGAIVEAGTPLSNLYGTTNGSPMETVAVQRFEPPVDLTHCAKVLVTLTSAETMPLLASLNLVAESAVEEAGPEMMGMKPAREETLEFWVPLASRPLLVRAIRILFHRPVVDRHTNVRVVVQRFTLVPRER